jgi:hypothetical protein
MHIGFVSYTHGDEHPPEEWKDYPCIIANRQAKERGVRYIETDLNRSFDASVPKTYEELRAVELREELKKFDVVIDIHRTEAPTAKFMAIISKKEDYSFTLPYVPEVVLLFPNAEFSLIGNVRHGVALEYPTREYSRSFSCSRPPIFSIVRFDSADPSWIDGEEVVVCGEKLYPFLVGGSSYNGKCFLAKKIE